MAGKHGLSRDTSLQGDIAKKGAVKVNCNYKIGDNHRPLANGGGQTHDSPGGSKGHQSTKGGWKRGVKP